MALAKIHYTYAFLHLEFSSVIGNKSETDNKVAQFTKRMINELNDGEITSLENEVQAHTGPYLGSTDKIALTIGGLVNNVKTLKKHNMQPVEGIVYYYDQESCTGTDITQDPQMKSRLDEVALHPQQLFMSYWVVRGYVPDLLN